MTGFGLMRPVMIQGLITYLKKNWMVIMDWDEIIPCLMVFSSFGVFNIRIEAHFSDGTNGTCLFNSADLIVIPINPNGS